MKQGKMWSMGPGGQEQFVPETLAAAVYMDEAGTQTLPEKLAELESGVVGPIGPVGPPGADGGIGPVGPVGPPGADGADGHTPTLAEIGAAAASHTHTPAEAGAAAASHTHVKANISDFAHTHPLGELSGVTPAAIGAAAASHSHTKANITDFAHTHTKANITDFAHTHPLGELSGVTPAAIGAAPTSHSHTKANISDFAHSHATSDITSLITVVRDALYPVGCIYSSTSATNPGTLFGGGWERYAVGRVLVGVSEGEGEFAGPGYTGGEKYHTLSAAEMPSVTGAIVMHAGATQTTVNNVNGCFSSGQTAPKYFAQNTGTSGATSVGIVNFNNGGSGWGHNNMQPFVAVYIWRRVW